MRATVTKVYPLTKPQICIFYINKNMALHIKRKWNKAAAIIVAKVMGALTPPSQED